MNKLHNLQKLPTESDEGQSSPTSELFNIHTYLSHITAEPEIHVQSTKYHVLRN